MENFKKGLSGALIAMAMVVAVFAMLGALFTWWVNAVPWVYAYAPRIGSSDAFPFALAVLTAFIGPAAAIGAVLGLID